MDRPWYKLSVVALGMFAASFGYILIVENALPDWAVLAIIAGGVYGSVVGVVDVLGPFGGVRQRILNVLLVLVLVLAPVVYPGGTGYVFLLASTLVIFAIVLRNVVEGSYDADGRAE